MCGWNIPCTVFCSGYAVLCSYPVMLECVGACIALHGIAAHATVIDRD